MDLEEQIAAAWAEADRSHPESTTSFFERLYEDDPGDPVRAFERASAYDREGREDEAIPFYEAAISVGLTGDRDRRARIQLGSSLRNVGRYRESVEVLEAVTRDHPGSVSAQCFLALALADAGRTREAVGRLVEVSTRHIHTDDMQTYGPALDRYARELHQTRSDRPGHDPA